MYLLPLILILGRCVTPWEAQVETVRIEQAGRTDRAALDVDQAEAEADAAQAYAEGERAKADAEQYRTLAEHIRADAQRQAIDAFFKAWGWLVALGFVAFALVLGAFVAVAAVRPRIVYMLPRQPGHPELPAGDIPDQIFLPALKSRKEVNRKT
jgi:hypothetical protein